MEEAAVEQQQQDTPRRLGGFGAPVVEPVQTVWAVVPYFDVDIRVMDDGDLLTIDLEEFISEASTISSDDASAMGLLHRFLKRMIHPDDFLKFWNTVRANRQDMDAQMAFAKYVIEEMTGHPTPLPSDSSHGPSATGLSSVGDVSSRAQQRLEEAGRADLANVVQYARERQISG